MARTRALRSILAAALLGAATPPSCGLNPQPAPPSASTPADASAGSGGSGGITASGGAGGASGGRSGAAGTGGSGPSLDAGARDGSAADDASTDAHSGDAVSDGDAPLDAGDEHSDAATLPSCAAPSGPYPLPGVCFRFPPQKTTFTLAEAAAGIRIRYELHVEADVEGVVGRAQDDGHCWIESIGPLGVREVIAAGNQSYCYCDVGLCAPSQAERGPLTLARGVYLGEVEWDGKNWNGPSDTGNAKGPPFPAGSYVLSVGTSGRWGADAATAFAFAERIDLVLVQ